MASSQKESTDKLHCVLCCEDIEFTACGSCNHPICLKCCVKLRMLRKENDCPVCRAQLKEVIVSKGYKTWGEKTQKPRSQHIRNFGIYHECPASQRKVDELLQHKCRECGEVFKTFPLLKDHVRKIHVCYYCDICLRHLRIFTHERKCYTREALIKHRKGGDDDDKSHRGHPMCEFCDERYLDNDELLLHLRKNHFWCHLCEKDGHQDYFPTYKVLRKHFRESHFLCEEDKCMYEQFTSVFRTKIDYQAHKAQKHANKLSKAEARQARQLDIDITFTPRQTESSGVVSGRDYTYPEQRNERYGARRPGNRERAAAGMSAIGGRDSFPREGSDGRQMRHVGRDSERPPRNAEHDKRTDRNSGRMPRGTLHDNVRDGQKTPGDISQNRRDNKDPERPSKSSEHGRRDDRDLQRASRDNGPDKKGGRDSERTSRDADTGKKTRSEVVIQDSQECTSRKGENTMETSHASESKISDVKNIKTKKDAVKSESTNGQHTTGTSKTNKADNFSQKSRASADYHNAFPALTSNESTDPKIVPSVTKCEQQCSNVSITKKKPAISSTAPPPAPKSSYQEEFPTLSAATNGLNRPNSAIRGPPGISRPVQPIRPPPGLTWNAPPSLVSQGTASATSQNSSGNTAGKNKQLIEQIRYILNHKGHTFSEFQEISGMFRNGLKTAQSYYQECCELLGEENIHTVFRKLIDLLPNEEKQRQLLTVYNDAKIRAKQEKSETLEASWLTAPSHNGHNAACIPQVPILERDFPALPKSNGKKGIKSQQKVSSAWVRGR